VLITFVNVRVCDELGGMGWQTNYIVITPRVRNVWEL